MLACVIHKAWRHAKGVGDPPPPPPPVPPAATHIEPAAPQSQTQRVSGATAVNVSVQSKTTVTLLLHDQSCTDARR